MHVGKKVITEIDNIRDLGKWIEFWFTDPSMRVNDLPESFYHGSSKSYKFYAAMPSDLFHKVKTHPEAISGLIVVWEWSGYNYEISQVFERNQKSLEIEEFRSIDT